MQDYMENRRSPIPAQAQALIEPKEQPFKAWFLSLNFGKSHLDCYRFCQQCQDYLDTARVNTENHTPFAVCFLWDRISTPWTEYKRRHIQEKEPDIIISWEEFKAFLCENCDNFKTFIKDIWNRFGGDSQYQLENVQDWASHLEHRQLILEKFDPQGSPEESDLICFV